MGRQPTGGPGGLPCGARRRRPVGSRTRAGGSRRHRGVTRDGQAWTGILTTELASARQIQLDSVGLKYREIEQAVLATFLHSQPIGQSARARDLEVLLAATRPDKIELEKGLDSMGAIELLAGRRLHRGGRERATRARGGWATGPT